MAKEVRVSTICYELSKSLKSGFMSHSIILTLHSSNATDCAYRGMHYTLSSIIHELQTEKYDISLQKFLEDNSKMSFTIRRTSNQIVYDTYLTIYKINQNNQILFQFIITSF